ncbi:MAG: hypothetical protein COA45_03945 [Zetaproteobacteria bacterium]|nr:MAG: hypothetical protein COA45_03945 [Zetaproteobacteria bacterium]
MYRNKLALFLTLLLCVISLQSHAIGLKLGLGLTAPIVIGLSEPAGQTAHIFLSIGNSHNIGRPAASGETFDAKVYEWTQLDALSHPPLAMLDHQNDTTTDISPDLSFSADYIAANPTIDRLVFVPHAQGSTGFSGNSWSADTVPNDLSVAVTRFNAAHAQLIADGYTVTVGGAFFHANRPDFDDNSHLQYQIDIDDMVVYLRANLTGGVNIPVIIGGGMTKTQLDARALSKDLNFQATADGTQHRVAYTGTYDWINSPRYGNTYVGLPVLADDGVHANRLGVIEQGHLRYDALLRAQLNTSPSEPFQSLTSWSNWKAFYDFRTGTGLDMTGNGFHATQQDAVATADMPYDVTVQSMAYIRAAGGTDKYWAAGTMLGASYTKAAFVKFDSLSTQGVMQDHNDGTRMHLSSGSGVFRSYHNSSSQRVAFPNTDIVLGKYHLIVLTYDAPSTTMKLYLDGSLKETNATVANHTRTTVEAIGAQTHVNNGVLGGGMVFAAFSDVVMSLTDVQALNTAAQGLVNEFVVQTPSEIPDLWAFYDPRVDGSITHISNVTSIVGDTFAANNATQNTEALKPTYNDAGDYIQFGGIAGDQEVLTLPDVDFAGDNFSISVWANADNLSSFIQTLIKFDDGTTSSLAHLYTYNNGDVIRFAIGDDAGNSAAFNVAGIVINEWNHVVVSVDRVNNIVKAYFNGTQSATQDISALTGNISCNSSASNKLGKEGATGAFSRAYEGKIGNVHVYKGRALTADDVTNIFNDGTANYSNP